MNEGNNRNDSNNLHLKNPSHDFSNFTQNEFSNNQKSRDKSVPPKGTALDNIEYENKKSNIK